MFQSSKFELDEIEDTTENKINFLDNTINEIIKETAREYFANLIDPEALSSIKKEFKNKVFTVLQNQYQKQQQQKKLTNSPPNIKSNTDGSNISNSSGSDNSSRNDSYLYSEQLKQFPFTVKIVNRAIEKIMGEQTEYISKARNASISSNLEYLDHNNETIGDFDTHEETLATIIELFLEYLRFSNPPILERKENRFEYMEI
jgi:magnesium chelatase subunit I